jgi:hypothetical protein
MLRMKRCVGWVPTAITALATMALLCAGVLAGGAWAGEYHVYSCRMPDGDVAPVDGWSGSPSTASDPTENTCNAGGSLVAGLSDGVKHEVEQDRSTWTFSAPPETTITAATLRRAGDADGGWATNATYEFWLAGPENNDVASDVIDECVAEFGCPTGKGNTGSVESSMNIVTVSSEYLGTHLYANVSCAGSSKFVCPSGKGDSSGYAAVVYLYAADLTLEQTSQPKVSKIEGELAGAPTLSGTADLSFHAEDAGSGVYQAVFTVDGAEDGRVLLDENGGRCRNVGQTTDGLPAFLYLQPCAASLDADIPFDTTTLTDGTHHLVVTVTNAAGNSTVALDRKVTVSNHPSTANPQQPTGEESGGDTNGGPPAEPSPQPTAGGGAGGGETNSSPSPPSPASQLAAPNGTSASGGATLQVRWSTTAKTALAGGYGRAQTVVGQLTAPNGAPIGGALLQVLSTPGYEGARTIVLPDVRTAADGSFRLRLPAALPSSRLAFGYTSRAGLAVPDVTAGLTLTVPASLRLEVTPRTSHVGGTIVFGGTLHGAPLPPGGKQIVLEARPGGAGAHSPWRQFQVRATRAHGRYRATYRFRLPGPIVYEFRAVSPAEADFPYGAGVSNVVRVRER